EPQVDEVNPERLQAGVDRLRLPPGVPRRALGGDEHLRAVEPAVPDRRAHALLIGVRAGGVDVPVADLERGPGAVVGVVAVQLPRPEADQRDGHAVGKPNDLLAGALCHAHPSWSASLLTCLPPRRSADAVVSSYGQSHQTG